MGKKKDKKKDKKKKKGKKEKKILLLVEDTRSVGELLEMLVRYGEHECECCGHTWAEHDNNHMLGSEDPRYDGTCTGDDWCDCTEFE